MNPQPTAPRTPKSAAINGIIKEKQNRPDLETLKRVYEKLHADPELPGREERTAHVVKTHLEALGFRVRARIGGHGVVGVLDNQRGPRGRTVLLKAELDALPIQEKTNLSYASTKRIKDPVDKKKKPVMHASGHDMHITMVLAAAALLQKAKKKWRGCLIVLFQPDSQGRGAKSMMESGLYDKFQFPNPNIVLCQHINNKSAGKLQLLRGNDLGERLSFLITIPGKGGHSTTPEGCINPILIASSLVPELQTMIQTLYNPNSPALVTCVRINAGHATNEIPDMAELTVEVRAFSGDMMKLLVEAIDLVVGKEFENAGVLKKKKTIQRLDQFVSPLINDPDALHKIGVQFEDYFGREQIQPMNLEMAMGKLGDDLAVLARQGIPHAYWTLRSTSPGIWDTYERDGRLHELPDTHTAEFAPAEEPTLSVGMEALAVAALTYLKTEGEF